ncbi:MULTISPECIES: type II toxin-antitoxin system prevent-host-death family antitoxin [Actinoalloteichus]|uniref:Antitoxin n=1 Tax=Actinoalloteichus fjordicus TaxID=1612552 RepID=A0AAC9LHE7_9PSEU|nr:MULTISPECIES: type II toxin-antitoxin system prevent-host-death family antitoxin [Actinoalloteichus]APU16965.1 prevent-host-death family protein [Actinoalloteichus fjordicus]APU23045.1 prevent-host-death family protein [Actinoalloteichus sp. GBA129-24]
MTSVEMAVTDARNELGPVTNRVSYGGETVYLTKHGRRAAALVPVAAAELLEDIEDLLDGEAVEAIRRRLADGTEGTVPFVRRTERRDS